MTLDDLTTPATVDEVKASIYAAIAATGIDTTVWKPGAPTRTMIAAFAIVLAGFSKLIALIAAMGFLALAKGEWLTQKARYDYDVERDQGTFATGEIELDNAGGGVHAGDPGDLVVTNPTTGKTYRNTEAFSIAAFETGVIVPIQAIEIGSASTSAPNTITAFETPLLGVTCTNPASVVGRDEESDPELQARCAAKTGTLSPNGPRDAYAYAALSATRPDGTSIGVTRVRTIPDGDGNVAVYVATEAGEVSDLDDLEAVDEAIQTQVVPLAVTATVESAVPLVIPVTYELWVRATSTTNAQIEDANELALTAFMARQPIGGTEISPDPGRVYVSAIEAVVGELRTSEAQGSVKIADLVKVVVTAPAADVTLDVDEAPVLGTVTVTAIHQVTGGLT